MLSLFLIAMFFYDANAAEPVGFWDGLGVFNLIQLGKLLLLVAVFFALEKFFNRKNRVLGYMAEISFGLFFIHGFYMLLYSKIAQQFGGMHPVLTFGVEFLLVFAGSIFTVYVLKIILKNKSRYVVGC
jgi:peptidoglycan/LPS O-acetylase OafA/YrhL